jgi:hypothetical protein
MGVLLLAGQNAFGQIVTYDFTGADNFGPTYASGDPDFVATDMSVDGPHPLHQHNGQLRTWDWPTRDTVDTTQDYLSFTLTPDAGFQLNLTEIQFDYDQNNQESSAQKWDLRTFRTSTGLEAQGSGDYVGIDPVTDVSVSLNNLQGVTESVEFRLYNFDAVSAGNEEHIDHDNIQVFGSVTAVPEPSHYAAAFGIFLIGFAAFRRYRHRAGVA